MRSAVKLGALVLVSAALACGGLAREEKVEGASETDGPSSHGSTGAATSESSDPTTGFGTSSGGGGPEVLGCRAVDLLFVIDDSGSMRDEQANLIASFPGFIGAMRAQLDDALGYHVGITTTDQYLGNADCQLDGALVVQTLGGGASNATCGPYSSGARYMTEADDLEAKFSCAAQVGIDGNGDERPMQMMLSALSPTMLGEGGCNEGFLRDDALLVVVITDEEDDHETEGCMGTVVTSPADGSPGGPQEWFDRLVEIKGGDERRIVVLSLVGPAGDSACPVLRKCDGGIEGAEVGTRLIGFTERFSYGFVGPVCEPYGPFFSEAISSIVNACEDFVPVG